MARRLHQGEVRWAMLPAPVGRRPVLILTRTGALRHLSNVTVAPITRTIRGIDTEVLLSESDGVPTVCAVSLDNIQTLPQGRMEELIAELTSSRMNEVFLAIRAAFAMA